MDDYAELDVEEDDGDGHRHISAARGRGGERGGRQENGTARGHQLMRAGGDHQADVLPSSAASFGGHNETSPVRRTPMTATAPIRRPHDPRCVGWYLYFPEEEYSPHFPYLPRIKALKEFFMSRPELFAQDMESGYVNVNYQDIAGHFEEPANSQEVPLSEDVREQPSLVLRAMSLAFYQAWHALTMHNIQEAAAPEERAALLSQPLDLPKVDIRLSNFSPVTPLRLLKANCIGKFVAIKGTVVRVSNIKPLVTTMGFLCLKCGCELCLDLPDGKYRTPKKCTTDGCRSRSFTPQYSSSYTQTIDFQTIRLQEIIEDEHRESGRIPRSVECELFHDLVDTCAPGDTVVVSGEVRVVSSDDGRRGRSNNADKSMFLIYICANSLLNTRKKLPGSGEGDEEDDAFFMHTRRDLYAISHIQNEEDTFRCIVHSLCPTIYGQELVKAGLVLGLFGGCQKFADDANKIPLRGDPHILVVGDPGLGKSQLLQALSNVAPRGVYVCGNTTTTAGLTVTLHKDSGTGDYALEAGALVLGDQGICCIDEFDKMGMQHQALLEAMEQQSISIAKAGVVCSLPARTSIIAAANPVGGHYDKSKTVSENIKMSSPLLSRFDLVFILLDEANEERDRMLSEHVMALHAASARRTAALDDFARLPSGFQAEEDGADSKPLVDRLRLRRHEDLDPIPPSLLRKYVAYARKYVHPKLSEDAANVLQEFYLDLRQRHQSADSTPITTRQIESLVRLVEARARCELREEATKQDALDVVEIMRCSLFDTYCDEFGQPDFERSQLGSGMSKKAQVKHFVAHLNKIAAQTYNSLFSRQQLKEIAIELGMQIGSLDGFIASLNHSGYLLKRGPRTFKLATTEF
eukprot:m.165434 g.165434  ORF g.165434 m.165434 type:complete len:862 (+) comp16425_c0_seq1:2650-5235(+)